MDFLTLSLGLLLPWVLGIAAILAAREAFALPAITGLARALWWGLLAWIALRFALLPLEAASRPPFPWEAWIGWATKARAWFEFGRITEFVDAREWFAASGNAWLDASPSNPATLPLVPVVAIAVAGLSLVSVLFAFPGSAQWIADAPSVDRAMIHVAPLLTVFIVLAFCAFAARWSAAHPLPITPDCASATAATANAHRILAARPETDEVRALLAQAEA
jgi:hypothetical protein